MAARQVAQNNQMVVGIAILLITVAALFLLLTGSIPGVGSLNDVEESVGSILDLALAPLDAVGTILDTVAETVGGGTNTVTSTVGGAVSTVTSALYRAPGLIMESINTAVETLVETIMTLGEQIDESLKEWNQSIRSDDGSGGSSDGGSSDGGSTDGSSGE